MSKEISHFFSRSLSSILTPAIISLSCLIAVAYLQLPRAKSLTEVKLNKADYQREEEIESLNLDILKTLPTFGFDNLIANWTMLRFVQYYGDGEARRKTGHSLTPKYFDIITKNDPLFVRAYLILSPAVSINAGRPDLTVALMNRGLKHLSPKIPYAYFVWLYKGIDELLFLGDIKVAKHSYQMARDWAKVAGNTTIEISAQKTVNFLSKNPNSKQAQVGAWFLVFVNARDKETQQLAINKIESLGGKLIIEPDGRVFAVPPKQD
ncbi:MAG: hypothetical protein MUD14_21750 [Hydrococcus sp. Prado102]|jgi:hypothetical protein|nr:hypothetical protein [Hydrococcus sp. Prado102]